MTGPTIESLLQVRGAWLKGEPLPTAPVKDRATLTRVIASNYAAFEKTRDWIVTTTDLYLRGLPEPMRPELVDAIRLAEDICQYGMAFKDASGRFICESEGRRYLTGGWLEELAWLAAIEAGAEEAYFGQNVGWKVQAYSGENEIDLIMRRGSHLAFVSCKALKSELDIQDRKHRNRLMDAVHEADNLADHFGRQGDSVGVLVTTDLIDENRGQVRYNALMGKAAVLHVRIIPLEELDFDKLTHALQELLQEQAVTS
jgi:hypothetical protein